VGRGGGEAGRVGRGGGEAGKVGWGGGEDEYWHGGCEGSGMRTRVGDATALEHRKRSGGVVSLFSFNGKLTQAHFQRVD
jgi:hypothetical protein